MGELLAGKTIEANDSFIESIGSSSAYIVDEQDRKMAIGHERL